MDEIASIQAALKLGRQQLGAHSETASLDVRVLLAHLLHRSQAWVLSHPDHSLPEKIQKEFSDSLLRLIEGEPLPYLLGQWEFYGRSFHVTPEVLIPRPETEDLIVRGLDFIDRRDYPCMAVDVGTGSGCIAITLAVERSNVCMVATDRSFEALRVAKDNAFNYGVTDQINWMQCDLLAPLQSRFDLVIANLPYIPSSRLSQLSVATHEPRLALDGGDRGVDLIKGLIRQLPNRLSEGGMALLEIDESHGNTVAAFGHKIFPRADVTLIPDLAGLDRYVAINLEIEA